MVEAMLYYINELNVVRAKHGGIGQRSGAACIHYDRIGVPTMARVIWRYTLSTREQQLWNREELRGWREALAGFVEDEARERGFSKYAIYGPDEMLIVKSAVEIQTKSVEVNV